ncbi:DNA-processing protein DprA [Candidatus Babeliales bacterium]|nr:DNA-processing protein DprA [Candidatus Babeliales bacterium]
MIHEKNRQVLLHLLLLFGIGPVVILKILSYLMQQQKPDQWCDDFIDHLPTSNLDLESLYALTYEDFLNMGLSEKAAQGLCDGLADKTLLEKELHALEKTDIRLITLFDKEYPSLLRHIHVPPTALYVRGKLDEPVTPRIAFVGARLADSYGQRAVSLLVPPLVGAGFETVSGGALGIDTMVHHETLVHGGKTIVVLGSGLLDLYPEQNEPLFEQVCERDGALVSPFPLRSAPERGHFPARNRIIAGLSQGCVVVQAAEKSGALITANFALEQGRQVFAVPGSIFSELSFGCHKLLAQGAKSVHNAQAIFEEFGYGPQPVPVVVAPAKRVTNEPKQIQKTIEKAVEKISELAIPLDPILVCLQEPRTLDELCMSTGFSLDQMNDKLFELHLAGKVKQNFSGTWQAA